MTIREHLEKLIEIQERYQAEAAEHVAALGPYEQTIQRMRELGLTLNSSADQIINAFAGATDLSPPGVEDVAQVLDPQAASEIRDLANRYLNGQHKMGFAVGNLIGAIAALK